MTELYLTNSDIAAILAPLTIAKMPNGGTFPRQRATLAISKQAKVSHAVSSPVRPDSAPGCLEGGGFQPIP
jgi:hypothetical protein